jgi:hypothetical protein
MSEISCLPSPAIAVYLLALHTDYKKARCPHRSCVESFSKRSTAALALDLAAHLENHDLCHADCAVCEREAEKPRVRTVLRCHDCGAAVSKRASDRSINSTAEICFRCARDSCGAMHSHLGSCIQQQMYSDKLQLTLRDRSKERKRCPPEPGLEAPRRTRVRAASSSVSIRRATHSD